MDRMAGLQDLQDKLCWAKLGVKNGQDGRISGLTGQGVNAQLGAKIGQDYWISGLTGQGVNAQLGAKNGQDYWITIQG